MTPNIWIAAGALFVTAITLITTLLSADRSKAQLEALGNALAIRDHANLPADSVPELEKFIKFTAVRLGSVWWRNPFFPLGVLCLGLAAAAWVPWAVLEKAARDEMGIAVVIPVSAAFLASAFVIFIGSWLQQKRAGLT